MEEVLLKGAEGGGADLQMDCVEEEQEAQSPNKDGAEEHCNEGAGFHMFPYPVEPRAHMSEHHLCVSAALEEDTPFRVIPIPVPPVSSCNSQHNPTVKVPPAPLGLIVLCVRSRCVLFCFCPGLVLSNVQIFYPLPFLIPSIKSLFCPVFGRFIIVFIEIICCL